MNQLNPKIPLRPVLDWEEDRRERLNPRLLTDNFRKSVPVLDFIKWEIREIDKGFTETLLPLCVESSNQYMAHQAALMLLSADYTGGLALCSLFNHVPVIGFHPQKGHFGAYMWGGKATIKWHRPSTDDLVCRARINPSDWQKLAKRFFNGGSVVTSVQIEMFNKDTLVAESNFTYWAKNSISLREAAREEKTTHILFEHKENTSAKLISGLRAIDFESQGQHEYVSIEKQAAGKQGLALAKKFCRDTPELLTMVSARTRQLDEKLQDFSKQHERFSVVNIGVGLDTRAYRLPGLNISCIYELDLPIMIRAREKLLPPTKNAFYPVVRETIDLVYDKVSNKLTDLDINIREPIFFIWEGGSFYFSKEEAKLIFKCFKRLLTNEQSIVWFDYASEDVVKDKTGVAQLFDFMQNMRRMGEPFVQGYAGIPEFIGDLDLSVKNCVACGDYIDNEAALFSHYFFCEVGQPAGHKKYPNIVLGSEV